MKLAAPLYSRFFLSGDGYLIQSKDPSFHSWNSPRIKIKRKIIKLKSINKSIPANILITGGKSRTISTSKIKKMTARRKNRKENGKRAEPSGSNPHSNGDLFSRSEIARLDVSHATSITIIAMMTAAKEETR